MPNRLHLPECPFYISDKANSISCEDTFRSFAAGRDKIVWIEKYCCREWKSCPYAVELNSMYDRIEKGADMELEKMEHKVKAQDKELRSKAMQIGWRDKKIRRMQKKIDELRAVNKSFVDVNENLQKQKKEFYRKWKESEAELNKGRDEVLQELSKLGIIYEQRMCYLIEMYAPGKMLVEDDVTEWATDKEFALMHDADPEHGIYWKVVYREDDKDQNVQDDE